MFASKYVIKVNVTIINAIKDIVQKIFHIILIPFKIIYNFIRKIFFNPIQFCIINVRKFSTKLSKNLLQHPKKNKKLVKN